MRNGLKKLVKALITFFIVIVVIFILMVVAVVLNVPSYFKTDTGDISMSYSTNIYIENYIEIGPVSKEDKNEDNTSEDTSDKLYTQEDVELLNQIFYENSDDMKALVSAYASVMDNEDGYCTIFFETPAPSDSDDPNTHKDDGIKSRQGVMLDKLYDEEFTDASRKMADKGIFCYVDFIKEGDKIEVHFYILPEIVAFSENNHLPNEIIYDDSVDEFEVSRYNYIEENWYSHIMEKPDY
ncbi:MAG: hypothetical protein IJ054_09515 [Lachnospiraceae bacterium]|nr:hypothetical protein [Lachnospiraceae bacterium]